MITLVDHIVILVNDLEQARANYTTLGFTVSPGGEHTGGATHNLLICFADGAYLELLAFQREEPAHRWWRHVAGGEGLIDFALLLGDAPDDIAAAASRGLALVGPVDGGRLRPDGVQLQWQTAMVDTEDLPFLIADVTPRPLRVPGGPATKHANGVTGIAGLTLAVRDLIVSRGRYQALLGSEPSPELPGHELPDDLPRTAFALGEAQIGLLQPVGDSSQAELLRARIAAHGEGIVALALRGDSTSQAGEFDLTLTHNARMGIVK
jgi:catechol 2,3-dioxygenase-like lactoylglutathione lyase family enzyme